MDLGGFPVLSTSLTNESSQTMGVTDAGWLFNGAGDIVVGVAQLVGQTLNLIRALPMLSKRTVNLVGVLIPCLAATDTK